MASFWFRNLVLLAKLWATRATIVFFCLSVGYRWATFVCSPVVAQRKDFEASRIFLSKYSLWKFLSLIISSFPLEIVASFWFRNLVLLAKLWATRATIVFFCLSVGYRWATFVCSPLVAQRKDFEASRIFLSKFSLWKFLSLIISSFP